MQISNIFRTFASALVNDMKTTQEYISILREHANVLQQQYGMTSMSLFGSIARGEQKEGSDVDVLVEMPPIFYNACAANDYLEDILNCRVDMVRKHDRLTPFFLKQVEHDGIRIF